MKIHEDFINAISYPILDFLNQHTDANTWDDKTKSNIQRVIEDSIRNGIVEIATQVDDTEALVIAALRSPSLVKVASARSVKNIALDAVAIAVKCREGITKHVRDTRNDSETNPLLG